MPLSSEDSIAVAALDILPDASFKREAESDKAFCTSVRFPAAEPVTPEMSFRLLSNCPSSEVIELPVLVRSFARSSRLPLTLFS